MTKMILPQTNQLPVSDAREFNEWSARHASFYYEKDQQLFDLVKTLNVSIGDSKIISGEESYITVQGVRIASENLTKNFCITLPNLPPIHAVSFEAAKKLVEEFVQRKERRHSC